MSLTKSNQSKYFNINDIINTAISKTFQPNNKIKEFTDISLTVLNEMAYFSIWNNFIKWISETLTKECHISLYSHIFLYYSKGKEGESINLRFSEHILSEFNLVWDEGRTIKKRNELELNNVKFNINYISKGINIQKIYIQNGLQNIFKAALSLLYENEICVVEIGILGNLYSQKRKIFHVPCKNINDLSKNKKFSIRMLMEAPLLLKKQKNEGKNEGKPDENKEKTARIDYEISEMKENISKSMLISNRIENISIDKEKSEKKDRTDFIKEVISKDKSVTKSKFHLIPLPKEERKWNFKEMINCSFKKNTIIKNSSTPILFNVYSNTKAAPFTGEKTQIPISHRIGSFYSLILQNYVIDQSTKRIKKLNDEYFLRIFSKEEQKSASEAEEYNALLTNSMTSIVEVRKNDYIRYQDAIKNRINDNYIAEIKETWLVNIIKMCLRVYNFNISANYSSLIKFCLEEITKIYLFSVKKSIIDYMLKHPEQREKLGISTVFRKIKEYSEAKVSRPSDNNKQWKSNFNASKLRISSNLMIMTDNIAKILKYYSTNLKKTCYLVIPQAYITMSLSSFIEMQKNKIEEQKKIINEDWKKYVELVLKENKINKDQLIFYFKSVSGVMSSQLRDIVVSSINKFHNFMLTFKKNPNEYKSAEVVFHNQFHQKFEFEQAFLEVSILANKHQFEFSEDLRGIHNKIIGLIQDLIKCSRDVERPDNMFIKNLEKQASLWEVPINDPYVMSVIHDIDCILKDNLDVLSGVLKLYDEFKFVITEKQMLIDLLANEHGSVLSQSPSNPNNLGLSEIINKKHSHKQSEREKEKDNNDNVIISSTRVSTFTITFIQEKIKLYEEKLSILEQDYKNIIYMNMIQVNCTKINTFLMKELKDCIEFLLKYIYNENISNKSKELIDEIDNKLKEKLSKVAENEEILYNMEQEYEHDKNNKIPEIYESYATFINWVFFYLKYDTYSLTTSNVKITGNEVGQSLEKLVMECYNSVKNIQNLIQLFINNNLKEKKTQFENNLNKRRERMSIEIEQINKKWEEIKSTAGDTLSQEENLLSELEMIREDVESLMRKMDELHVTENLLSSYNSEDEKLQVCLKQITPLLDLIKYYKNMKNKINEIGNVSVRLIDFSLLLEYTEKIPDMLELISTAFPYIRKQKFNQIIKEMELFKNSVELGRLIYNLIEILKVYENLDQDQLSEDSRSIIEENKIYCIEFTKLTFKSEKGQDMLKSIYFKHLQAEIELYIKNKIEIDRIVSEWSIVKGIFDLITKMSIGFDMKFEIVKYKDTVYKVILHDNLNQIKNLCSSNLENLTSSLEGVETFKNPSVTVEKMKKFKNNINELYEIIVKMESLQLKLEYAMNIKGNYNNMDLYSKLKVAEGSYKSIIERIYEYSSILDILKDRKKIKEYLKDIEKSLSQLKLSEEENSEVEEIE